MAPWISSSGTSALNISDRHPRISPRRIGVGEQKIRASIWFCKKSKWIFVKGL